MKSKREFAELRQQAERKLADSGATPHEALSPEEIRQRLNELHLHQIDFYDLAPVGYATVSENRQILQANLTMATLLGVVRRDLVEQLFTRFLFQEDQDVYYLHSKRLLGSGEPQRFELRMVKSDGTPFWVHMVMAAAQDDGRAPVFRIVVSDSIDRKHAEEALREREEQLRFLLNSAPTVIYSCRVCGDFGANFVSDNVQSQLGYRPNEFVEDSAFWANHIHPDDVERVFAGLPQVFEQGSLEHEYRFRHQDGTYRWMLDQVRLLRDASGQPAQMVGSWIDISDRKQTEEKLRAEQAFREAIALTLPSGIAVVDNHGRQTYVNPAFCTMVGWSAEELQGRPAPHVYWPADQMESINHALQRTLEGKAPSEGYELVFVHKDGRRLPVQVTIVALREGERQSGWLANVIDISERKRAEKTLRNSEIRLRAILNATPFPIALVDSRDHTIEFWSRSALTLFQHTAPTVTEWYQLAYPDLEYRREVIERWKPALEKARLSGQAVNTGEYRVTCHDGSQRICELYATFVEEKLIVTFHDITERKRAEEALQASSSQITQLLQSTDQGIYGIDLEGSCTFINRSGMNILGYPIEDCIGKNMHQLIHHSYPNGSPYPEDECPILCAKLTGAGSRVDSEVLWRGNGSSFPAEYSSFPIVEDGQIRGAVVAFSDITERKRAEEERDKLATQLRQAQKMEAIGTLAGGIAHDFNNILQSILVFAELAQDDMPKDHPAQLDIEEILTSANRARDLVGRILAFSRQTPEIQQPLQLQPILKDALKLLRASLPSTIEICQEVSHSCGLVLGDPIRLHQVIMNLCTNAYHAMLETGGLLTIQLDQVQVYGETAKAHPDLRVDTYARLAVSDTGRGIEEQNLNRIFDPFFTTKKVGEGSGLGLSVVHGIVRALGGAIRVDSKVGTGTQFEVFLPICPVQVAVEKSKADVDPLALSGTERILFVDDEVAITLSVSEALGKYGYHVETCADSEKARGLFMNDPGGYDVVVTDQTMPHLTGMQLALELLRVRADLPIILCTGNSDMVDSARPQARGVREFLKKPYQAHTLVQAIRRVLDVATKGIE